FAGDGKLYLIIARQRQRPARSFARIESARNLNGVIVAKIPSETVHALIRRDGLGPLDSVRPFRWLFVFLLLLTGEMPNDFALSVHNIECYLIVRFGFEVVIDERAGRWIIAHRLAAIEFGWVMQSQRSLWLIQKRICDRRRRIDLTQRGDVIQHPKRASEGSGN